MRELKFRAWDKIFKFYVGEDDFIGITFDGKCLIYQDEITDEVEFSKIDDFIIEQYTGLKDKNGEKIYEGDILRLTRKVARDKSTLYQVVWNEHIAGFDTKNLDKNGWDIGYLNETAAEKDYLVIGNIHENKELLGGE